MFNNQISGEESRLNCGCCQFLWYISSLHGGFQATHGVSLNTELGRDAVCLCEPLYLLNIFFLFYFCVIFNILSYFLLVLLGNIVRGNNPFSIWIFHDSSNASRMPLLVLLILNPSAVAGAVNDEVPDVCLVSWHPLLDSPGVILPVLHLQLFLPSLIFYGSLSLPLSTFNTCCSGSWYLFLCLQVIWRSRNSLCTSSAESVGHAWSYLHSLVFHVLRNRCRRIERERFGFR